MQDAAFACPQDALAPHLVSKLNEDGGNGAEPLDARASVRQDMRMAASGALSDKIRARLKRLENNGIQTTPEEIQEIVAEQTRTFIPRTARNGDAIGQVDIIQCKPGEVLGDEFSEQHLMGLPPKTAMLPRITPLTPQEAADCQALVGMNIGLEPLMTIS